jgi:4-nitrophenyl phosphatase
LGYAGHHLAVLTNNTTHSTCSIVDTLGSRGFPAERLKVVSPVGLLAKKVAKSKPKVLVIGSQLVKSTVEEYGGSCTDDDQANLVVVGGGGNADEAKLSIAVRAILKNRAELVALHKNKLYVDEYGERTFGVGGIVAGLEYCCDVTATVLGKPSPTMYIDALSNGSRKPSDAVMISDDFYSDLPGAAALGMKTIFVATGKYSIADFHAANAVADIAIRSLDELVPSSSDELVSRIMNFETGRTR